MNLATSVLRFGCMAIAWCVVPSCSSKLIRLGDQTAAESLGGSSGTAGTLVQPGHDGRGRGRRRNGRRAGQ